MTPAERDEARAAAERSACCRGPGQECGSDACALARAVLRYVPPGDVATSLLSARAAARQVVAFDGGICTAHSARRIAAEFNAAADAAEETDR